MFVHRDGKKSILLFFAAIRSLIFMLAGVSFQISFSPILFYTFLHTVLKHFLIFHHIVSRENRYIIFFFFYFDILRLCVYENTSKRCLLELKSEKEKFPRSLIRKETKNYYFYLWCFESS
jgi:hypothetical protein